MPKEKQNIAILVYAIDKKEPRNEPIRQDLFWYDHEHHEMLKFQGSRLDLINKVYDVNLQRFVPTVINGTTAVNHIAQDKKLVLDWFMKYSNYTDIDASEYEETDDGYVFFVPKEEMEDLLDEFERSQINFSVLGETDASG